MPRVKGGYTTRRRRKAVLKLAKGYYGSKKTLYKTANEQVMRSLAYAYRDRKDRKRQFRKLWITRINAGAMANGMKYSRFMSGLSKAGVEINRKMLAEMAVNDKEGFAALVELSRKNVDNKVEVKEENVVVLTRSQIANKADAKTSTKKETVKKEVVPAKETTKATKEAAPVKETAKKETVKKEIEPAKEVKEAPAKKTAEVKETTKATKEAAPAGDLESMTLTVLKALAKEKGLSGYSALKKQDLIELIKKA